jgi:transcriptional regulator with XRE-family HTH domain
MTIGERIKQRRLELGYSQDELAKKVGYKSRSSINKLELSRELPARKISLMARALETTEGYLMGWTEDRDTPEIDIISDNETNLIIERYNRLPEDLQKELLRYAEFLLERSVKND